MSEYRRNLIQEFRDREYREAYADDFLNTYIATQLKVVREQRELKQVELADMIGTKQTGISRFENVNYSAWNLGTLRKLFFALGLRLKVSGETFGSLLDEAEEFSRESLKRPTFEEDPAFKESQQESNAVDDAGGFMRSWEDVFQASQTIMIECKAALHGLTIPMHQIVTGIEISQTTSGFTAQTLAEKANLTAQEVAVAEMRKM